MGLDPELWEMANLVSTRSAKLQRLDVLYYRVAPVNYGRIYGGTQANYRVEVRFKTRVGVFCQIKNARRSRAFYRDLPILERQRDGNGYQYSRSLKRIVLISRIVVVYFSVR
jgi:hypothetical protein